MKADIYTALLGLSLLAIVVAIVLLLMEMSNYHWDYEAQGARGIGALRPSAVQQRDGSSPEVRHALGMVANSSVLG